MTGLLLTQYDGAILGPIAKILGYIMEGIFNVLYAIKIPNIGLAIILFTIVMNMLLLPLTIKQQKFSKLSAKMNPEIQAIQAKYRDKKDNESMMAMNQETQAVYAKYGVSPTGSCVQLIIQMPVLFALYRVVYAVPAYVTKVKDIFVGLADSLYAQQGIRDFIQGFSGASYFNKQFKNELFINNDAVFVKNTIIDCLNRASTAEWNDLSLKFSSLSSQIADVKIKLEQYNNFLGLNIANSPSYTVKSAFESGQYLLVVGGLLIPFFAAATQWINTKLMPQTTSDNPQDTMAQTMKSMNIMMPLMSAVLCYSVPIGMGIYWIAGAVIRSVQQVMINKHIDKMDIEEVISKNASKAKKKIEKQKENVEKMSAYANMKTRNISSNANMNTNISRENDDISTVSNKNLGPIASKANLVQKYNDKKN